MPNNLVFEILVLVIVVQVLGKYMIIGYLDLQGYPRLRKVLPFRDSTCRWEGRGHMLLQVRV